MLSTGPPPLHQALGKALLELRSEMTALAEQQIISGAVQREESLNVQTLVDKHTKELKVSERSPVPSSYPSASPSLFPRADTWIIAARASPSQPRLC